MHASSLSLVVLGLTLPAAAQSAALPDHVLALDAWRARHGSNWTAHSDATTGRAEWIYGGAAQWPGLPRTDDEWIARARTAVAEAQSVLGVDVRTLGTARVLLLPLGMVGSGDKWSVEFRQSIGGLRVHGGTVHVLFDARGALISVQTHAVTDADGVVLDPLVERELARERAVTAFTKQHAPVATSVVESGLVVLPVDEPGRRAGRLAWEIDVQSEVEGDEPVGRRYWIDARTGFPLRDESSVHFFDITGTISTMATPGTQADTASNPETSQPAKYIRVQHSTGIVYTDANGVFTIPGAAPAQNVTLSYAGRFANVDDEPSGAPYTLSVPLAPGPGNAILLNPASVNTVTSQANIFNHVSTVRDYIRRIVPSDSTADRVFTGHANINSTCNAYYDGGSINFFAAGGNCNNTAFSTVVAHEQGHWLNDLYGTYNGPDGMGEGNADVFALYVFDTHLNGQGFFTNGGAVRSGLNTRQFCGDCTPGCYGGVHADGEPWMGAAWKVRTNLNTSLGNTIGDLTADQLFMGWLNAYDQREIRSIIELQWLILDDDDANLANGTPHAAAIRSGFRVQGFPGYFMEFTDVSTVPEPTCERNAYPVTAVVRAVQDTTITAVTLSYRVGSGAFVDVAMAPIGGDAWRGDIPHVASPATVEYTVRATDSGGNVKVALCETRSFFIGEVIAFVTQGFESTAGWTHGTVAGAGNPNDDWQRGIPQGESGDPAVAAQGSACWGNDLGITGSGAGNGAYQADVHNYLSSPTFNCTGQTNVNLIFQRWLTVEKSQYDVARVLVNGVEVWRNPFGVDLIDTAWTLQSIDISAIADGNPSVTVRFELQSDGGLEFGGWTVDNLQLGRVVAAPSCDPGVSYCAGDGSSNPCPCGNESVFASGEGCRNSLGSGAKLVSSGVASLASDSVVLSGTQMPNSSALYFQGTSQQGGGLGVAFGDGLRCVGGSIVRLGTESNIAGASQYPGVGDPPVSVRGLLPAAGGTRHYQVWYRNALAGFCTPSTFNLSNGVSIAWAP